MDLRAPEGSTPTLNADAPWAAFDPRAYIDHNYRDLLNADAEILERVRDHFSNHFRENFERPVLGIDVGAGANLYPALSMLPWCREITLFERAPANVAYLRSQRDRFDDHWDSFWELLRQEKAYEEIHTDRRDRFRKAVRVRSGDLFDLTRRNLIGLRPDMGRWQIGTMFFVAESLTGSYTEFRRAVECFMLALAPGAPFAAAFMEGSSGYDVGNQHFPACNVSESQVYDILKLYGKVDIWRLGESSHMVRPGHTGMILVCGHRNADFAPSALSTWLNMPFRRHC
ncbi:methyltransferase [Streptomyces phyllanthi]|uniref:Methyltransferase n=1 Tax=Streptomyces phyllanthi TaxID=1803180 RepID=A0A5N8W1D5_9ACTN|nr:methyltransferase [Streptomyces phyllanthi]